MKNLIRPKFIACLFVITSILALSYFNGNAVSKENESRSVRYLLFKAVDKDSDRSINGASVTFNDSYFTSSTPSGLLKVDILSDQLKKHDFLKISALRDGYYDATMEISIKDPSTIKQPVKIFMKQKMAKLNGMIKGCWYDGDGHHDDKYAGDEIKVFGQAVSTQQVIYKFNADDLGNFKILNLPLGTYELEIRHKKWEVVVGTAEVELDREFTIRKCNHEEFHKASNKK
ncbi:MAG TPA: hypothetical protein PKK26_00270 [Candidatus Wallbacteria bacterium]|nr:hypothetical protein [Candidatus Wallbacteria bacterium]